MEEKIIILDFGSQYTQLIARRVRELNVYCEIWPFSKPLSFDAGVKGIILSGSPSSVSAESYPKVDITALYSLNLPILGICYGAQLMAKELGGTITPSDIREYGRAVFQITDQACELFAGVENGSQVWMSHGDTITQLPEGFTIAGRTIDVKVGAYSKNNQQVYGLQFHPEVYHTTQGLKILGNFTINICGCKGSWTPASFVDSTVHELKQQLNNDKVVLGLSGGVDSTVAAVLLHKAIGTNLTCIFVDNGLLRKNEYQKVLHSYQNMGLHVIGVDASDIFLDNLNGVSEPEAKRKSIGKNFIDVFQHEAEKIKGVKWLAQGTIYPDVIESVSVNGPSVTIKSHHNVGGLPEKMHLKVVEPLRSLFKDEVRRVGRQLQIDPQILNRHPFPGPGLAIRILGDITKEKIKLLQEVDDIFVEGLKEYDLYDKVWQAGVMLLPVNSVGVMGDERTYESVVALRAVASTDGMTADWVHLPYDFLSHISNKIINSVAGVNRVVYDISSKPPSTIEWE